MPDVLIADSQVRIKDSFAPAPIINLTLRANGEEKVMVMDSFGNFVQAGIPVPDVAPSFGVPSTTANPAGLLANMWVAYRYVYAATTRYLLVENDITAGGNVSPRGNPSTIASIQIPAANAYVNLLVTESTRTDLDAIWLYRTDYYPTQAEAVEAAELGDMFFVASVPATPAGGTIPYQDTQQIVSGNESIELDNFMAEQFALAIYADPYFYGFGNFPFEAPISVTAAGVVTLTNPWSIANRTGDKWFDGRNGQIVTLDGVDTGGFDGFGSYYFKWLTPTTAQLCLDLQLLQNGPVNMTGTTTIRVKGPATNLYRSKARNPFSWGEVIMVGDEAVPTPWVIRVGGGQGTAMAIVPVLSLLKLDTEAPNKTYVFNLKSQTKEIFVSSKEEISSDFTAGNQWAQFYAKSARGISLLWFIDNKFKVVCQSDGSANEDVSSPIFETIRQLSELPSDRLFAHGVYDPTLQISAMWLTRKGSNVVNDVALIYHHPTNTWSTYNHKGVLCSLQFLDRTTNQEIVLIGTDTGYIARAFNPNTFSIITDRPVVAAPMTFENDVELKYQGNLFTAGTRVKGIWMTFIGRALFDPDTSDHFSINVIVGYARVFDFVYNAGLNETIVTFDKFRDREDHGSDISGDPIIGFSQFGIDWSFYGVYGFHGHITCSFTKTFDLDKPFNDKKTTDSWLDIHDAGFYAGRPSMVGLIQPDYPVTNIFAPVDDASNFLFTRETRVINQENGTTNRLSPNYFSTTPLHYPDSLKKFRFTLQDVSISRSKLYGYGLTFVS